MSIVDFLEAEGRFRNPPPKCRNCDEALGNIGSGLEDIVHDVLKDSARRARNDVHVLQRLYTDAFTIIFRYKKLHLYNPKL